MLVTELLTLTINLKQPNLEQIKTHQAVSPFVSYTTEQAQRFTSPIDFVEVLKNNNDGRTATNLGKNESDIYRKNGIPELQKNVSDKLFLTLFPNLNNLNQTDKNKVLNSLFQNTSSVLKPTGQGCFIVSVERKRFYISAFYYLHNNQAYVAVVKTLPSRDRDGRLANACTQNNIALIPITPPITPTKPHEYAFGAGIPNHQINQTPSQ